MSSLVLRAVLRSTILPGLVFGVAVLLPQVASAQLKVGVINYQRALLETAEMKKASADLQARYKPRQDQLEKLQKDLGDIQAKLGNPQTPPAQAAELQVEGTRKQREATRIGEDLQADVERDRNDILQKGAVRMTEVVKKMAEEKGFDVIMDVTNAVFFKPTLEVTQEAVAAYDKAYPSK
jgi:outer membrane protein